MKLGLSYQELGDLFDQNLIDKGSIDHVSIDTRKIVEGSNTLFVALKGEFRDGHHFIQEAYDKGVRLFLVEQNPDLNMNDASFIVVRDPLGALQNLAAYHRSKFEIPLIAITGSAGKTIVKEWLGQLLSKKFRVVRSPKSYNSQIGVALSLLEIRPDSEIAIIEAGISKPGEMAVLKELIRPTHGIFTMFGKAHRDNFSSAEEHIREKVKLFEGVESLIAHSSIELPKDDRTKFIDRDSYTFIDEIPFHTAISKDNASLAVAMAMELGVSEAEIREVLPDLEAVVLRMETFEGVDGSIIINDSYNLDIDAFRSSLEYQLSLAKDKERVVIVGTQDEHKKREVEELLQEFQPIRSHFVTSNSESSVDVKDCVVLIKGNRSLHMELLASQFRLKKHATFVEINLNSVRSNIQAIKKHLPDTTQVLAMVKAASYGSGEIKMAQYLEQIGIEYLGVAYADEGVELRNAGISLPILVMNAEPEGFQDCIKHDLEPAIFSVKQLHAFIGELIYAGRNAYPIHLVLETGMNRLGIAGSDLAQIIELLQAQPEVHIKSAYSHLATADDPKSDFVHEQAARFREMCSVLSKGLSYPYSKHLLNSSGALNFSEYHFDMVRLGIGMYGYLNANVDLEPALKWHSVVSQVKNIRVGDSVGYDRMKIASEDMTIAIIPVGYADGLRRSLSNGQGQLYIGNKPCEILGNICMDMTMIDVTGLDVKEGDSVEIIGENQTMEELAKRMNTIPYEVMTSISKRVHRIYSEE